MKLSCLELELKSFSNDRHVFSSYHHFVGITTGGTVDRILREEWIDVFKKYNRTVILLEAFLSIGREKFSGMLIFITDSANSDSERYEAACKSLMDIYKRTAHIVILVNERILAEEAKETKSAWKKVVTEFNGICRKAGLRDPEEVEDGDGCKKAAW